MQSSMMGCPTVGTLRVATFPRPDPKEQVLKQASPSDDGHAARVVVNEALYISVGVLFCTPCHTITPGHDDRPRLPHRRGFMRGWRRFACPRICQGQGGISAGVRDGDREAIGCSTCPITNSASLVMFEKQAIFLLVMVGCRLTMQCLAGVCRPENQGAQRPHPRGCARPCVDRQPAKV